MRGERLSEHLSTQQLLLAAATVLLSPYLPLLFMGEEYAETAPFPYFVSHGDADLVEAVRKGRQEEFAAFGSDGTPPDPQAVETFLSAKLDQDQRHTGPHHVIFDFYRKLIRLRKEYGPFSRISNGNQKVIAYPEEQLLAVIRNTSKNQLIRLFNFSNQNRTIPPSLVNGTFRILLDSESGSARDNHVTVYATRPTTFLTLAPFCVGIYQKE
jgi:maltooligosyltrehalose trehalohydrolase